MRREAIRLLTAIFFAIALLIPLLPAASAEVIDLGGAKSICADGETLYLYTDGGIFAYTPETGEKQSVINAEKLVALSDAVLCFGDCLYIVAPRQAGGSESAKVYRVENGRISVSCDLYGTELDDPSIRLTGAIYLDGYVYVSALGASGSYSDGYALGIDLGGARVSRLPLHGCAELTSFRDGKLLATLFIGDKEAVYRVFCYDPKSGAREGLFDLTGINDRGVTYSKHNNAIYCYVSGALRSWRDGQWALISRIPLEDSARSFALIGEEYIAVSNGSVSLHSIRKESAEKTLLTIRGGLGVSDADYAFQLAHADVSIERTAQAHFCAEEIFQAVQTGDSTDLFVMFIGSGLRRLIEKGYAAPVSSSRTISMDTELMYPVIAAPLRKDGEIYAVVSDIIPMAWLIRTDAGLTAPETLRELLNMQERWENCSEYDGTPYVAPAYGSSAWGAREYADYLLHRYILEKEALGERISFSEPEFIDTLSDIASYGQRHDEAKTGTDLRAGGLYTADAAINTGGNSYNENRSIITPPTVLKGAQPRATAIMGVYVLNPLSENKDLAIAYLEAIIENRNASVNALMRPNANESVMLPDTQALLDDISLQRADAQARLLATAEEQKRQIEEDIEMLDYRIDSIVGNPVNYIVYPPLFNAYRERVAPYLDFGLSVFVDSGAHLSVYGDLRAVIDQCLSAAITPDDCVRRLGDICRMANIESER